MSDRILSEKLKKHTLNKSKFFWKMLICLFVSKRLKKAASAPALTPNPALKSAHPLRFAVTSCPAGAGAVTVVSRVKAAVALASRSRKTLALAAPPSAFRPRVRVGMTCPVILAFEEAPGVMERDRAEYRGKRLISYTTAIVITVRTTVSRIETSPRSMAIRGGEKELGTIDVIVEADFCADADIESTGCLGINLEAGSQGQDPREIL
jgi:hypothetical protein